MATDRHHSAFDRDEFERYDTFDAPVADDVDPGRHGLGGAIGRLLDKIRVDNAANKLERDVSLGEDRVLTASGNWLAVPHRELYASVHTDNDPGQAYALAREWTDLGNMMAENSLAMDAAIRSTETGWQGTAAAAARKATLKLATWGGDAAQTSQYMGTRIADQGLAAERAKAAMPEPVEFDYARMLHQGFATGGLAGLVQAGVDVQVASAQARSAHEQAARVMSEMESQSRSVDETTPRFVRPPQVADGPAEPMNLLSRNDSTAVSAATPMVSALRSGQPATPAGFAADGGATAPGGGGFPGGAGFPGGGGDGSPTGGGAASTPAPRSAQTYVPPHLPEPDLPALGTTSAAGYVPPTTSGPGGHPVAPAFQGTGGGQYPGGAFLPGAGGTGGDSRRPDRPGQVPPKVDGGQFVPPGDPRRGAVPSFGGTGGGSGGGAGGGGMPGGGGTSGAGGFTPRAATGGGGLPGAGASVGAAVPGAEQARAAAGAARPGAAGQPGMGAPGGMGGGGARGGEDDKEHRNKYATHDKVVEEPGRMVPQVIGEKSARQLTEERGTE